MEKNFLYETCVQNIETNDARNCENEKNIILSILYSSKTIRFLEVLKTNDV